MVGGLMMTAAVTVGFLDGTSRSYPCLISAQAALSLKGEGSISRDKTEFELFEKVLVAAGIDDRDLTSFGVELIEDGLDTPSAQSMGSPSMQPDRSVRHCRSLLGIARIALPEDVYEDAVAEWMDEIESAATNDRPVIRRAVSILIRSLPVLAWRSRLPSRVRHPGSQ